MTLNEEHNIEYALRSVRPWCDEVVVVDMMSDDRTQEIARRYVDQLLTHERVGFVEPARVQGFAAATGDWIINIDADEVVSPGLARKLRELAESDPPYDVFLVPRANVFLGRWLKHTPWWPGKPRFFRKGKMNTSTRIHHGFQPVEGARIGTIERDPGVSMWHYSYTNLGGLTEKMNKYTSIEAEQALGDGKGDPSMLDFVGAPLRALAPYVLRGGYRDGIAGFAYAMNTAYYAFLKQAKRWDQTRSGDRQKAYDEMREEMVSGFDTEQAIDPPKEAD